ncbi:CYTH and CHAD domain-containing protein [Acetonema longum]|uniref:Adenylate cyclase n=1 Tax=Acetonema longum DSM 6540 TaxID=1009370 RepID=F7NGD7_9FIRM|nr:CYTH and CHAD domain-containing protein [Acetonema longum]EGO64892.1 adenylate cyclase [Acetonema longum DSM 6540]
MSVLLETELKLRVIGSGDWEKLVRSERLQGLDRAGDWQEDLLEARYFDTADYRLRKAGLAYRVRREQGQWMATVKLNGSSTGGLHQRQEHNMAAANETPDLSVFTGLEIGELLRKSVGEESLIPVFTTRFCRRTLLVNWQDSQVEIALDQGQILAGADSEPILEIELELKQGATAAVLSLGAELAEILPLTVEPKSKYYRGLLLAGLIEEEPVPDALCLLSGAEPAGQALEQLLSAAVSNVFGSQQAFLDNQQQPKALRQLRIKLRRLRALLSFASPFLAAEETAVSKQELRSWGRSLGSLRDLDVLAGHWHKILTSPFAVRDGKSRLEEQLAALRLQQEETVGACLTAGKLTAVLLRLWGWIANHPWQVGAARSIESYAGYRLEKWLEDLLETGKALDWNDRRESHQFRIRMKKIRYVLESLSFMDSGRTSRLVRRFKAFQDCLGILMDYEACSQQLHLILKPASAKAVYRDVGLLNGWLARDATAAQTAIPALWRKAGRSARRWRKD